MKVLMFVAAIVALLGSAACKSDGCGVVVSGTGTGNPTITQDCK